MRMIAFLSLFVATNAFAEPFMMECRYKHDPAAGIEIEQVSASRAKATYIIPGRQIAPVMVDLTIKPAPTRQAKDEVEVNVNNVIVKASFERKSFDGEGVIIKGIINSRQLGLAIECTRNQLPPVLF